ncbi:acyl carrier protein [Streptomyces sp. NBC_01136]|uniref:acyl carrier protein n=1 Tax=unclassified Streptomyces TaxID=2593676 RepID=UPI0032565693|nr:acyl carrier protein [Streptomyces sp. NBC_01136]WST81113.1 acyl carrier protein [Streptomyces sp. NBC_01136]
MTPSPPWHTEAPLYQWLTTHLAVYLDRLPESIDPTVPLAEYGMDSVCALSLCGDIEDDFAIAVEPLLVWDHPTVALLAAHLTARGADADGGLL